MTLLAPPDDKRALVAVDLGAESCRVSLLQWRNGLPDITLLYRFPNGPVRQPDGSLRWPWDAIVQGVEHGLRLCAAAAHEGIRSVAIDGWAVDYVRLDRNGHVLDQPFCYRDERTLLAEQNLHTRISPERLRELTGIQLQRLNTLYQLHADRMAGLSGGTGWLNLPEFLLHRWGGAPVAEYTNATHTGILDLESRSWSAEILEAAGIDPSTMPPVVPPGTRLGQLSGELAKLPAFRSTELIAPACHDTASALAAIPASGDDWAYISSGTWSLVGCVLSSPCNAPSVRQEGFTNLGGVGSSVCFHRSVNGMWLLKQCMETWEGDGKPWRIEDLLTQAEHIQCPAGLLNVDEADLLPPGNMPARINTQRRGRGLAALDESPTGAPAMTSLILHSLAARYREVLRSVTQYTGKPLQRLFVVGGGSRNAYLLRLTAEATGLQVLCGSPESSTLGNFAVQLASLEAKPGSSPEVSRENVTKWAARLQALHA